MANGGLDAAASCLTIEEEDQRVGDAMKLCKDAHKATEGRCVKTYDVAKIKIIPGTARASAKSKSKLDNLAGAIDVWPHLFVIDRSDIKRLQVDVDRYESLVVKYGAEKFGGLWESWPTVWAANTVTGTACGDRVHCHEPSAVCWQCYSFVRASLEDHKTQ